MILWRKNSSPLQVLLLLEQFETQPRPLTPFPLPPPAPSSPSFPPRRPRRRTRAPFDSTPLDGAARFVPVINLNGRRSQSALRLQTRPPPVKRRSWWMSHPNGDALWRGGKHVSSPRRRQPTRRWSSTARSPDREWRPSRYWRSRQQRPVTLCTTNPPACCFGRVFFSLCYALPLRLVCHFTNLPLEPGKTTQLASEYRRRECPAYTPPSGRIRLKICPWEAGG
jgi:hypothetical protein